MRKILSLSCVLACAQFGCASTGTSHEDAYEQAAQEVESAVAALDQEDSDDTAIDGAADDGDAAAPTDDDGDSDEATDEANGGHEGEGRRGDRRGGHHGRGHRHGRGHDLLLWYADLDALQLCRDLRATCQASADPQSCKQEVHDCVKPVLDAAFAAMCEERTAMCAAEDAPERQCKRVAKHCGGEDDDAVDGG